MKKFRRNGLALILSLAMTLSMLPVHAFAQEQQDSITLVEGETTVLNPNQDARARNATLDGEDVWESSDSSVATVDTTGTVSAIGEGTATITYTRYTEVAVPVAPVVPPAPVVPETPVVPEDSDAVETPEDPDVVETPETPDVVETPETPDVVETPEDPDVVETPETPDVVETPEDPDVVESEDNAVTEISDTSLHASSETPADAEQVTYERVALTSKSWIVKVAPAEIKVREYHVLYSSLGAIRDYYASIKNKQPEDFSDYNCTMVKYIFNDGFWVVSAANDVYQSWSATVVPKNHQPEDLKSVEFHFYRVWLPHEIIVTIPAEKLSIDAYDESGLLLDFAEVSLKVDPPAPNTVNFSGEKRWVGDENYAANRPTPELTLLADGQIVPNAQPVWTDTEGSTWGFTYSNLPQYQEDRQTPITYTATEADIPDYTATYFDPAASSFSLTGFERVEAKNESTINLKGSSWMVTFNGNHYVVWTQNALDTAGQASFLKAFVAVADEANFQNILGANKKVSFFSGPSVALRTPDSGTVTVSNGSVSFSEQKGWSQIAIGGTQETGATPYTIVNTYNSAIQPPAEPEATILVQKWIGQSTGGNVNDRSGYKTYGDAQDVTGDYTGTDFSAAALLAAAGANAKDPIVVTDGHQYLYKNLTVAESKGQDGKPVYTLNLYFQMVEFYVSLNNIPARKGTTKWSSGVGGELQNITLVEGAFTDSAYSQPHQYEGLYTDIRYDVSRFVKSVDEAKLKAAIQRGGGSFDPDTQEILWYTVHEGNFVHVDGIIVDSSVPQVTYHSNYANGPAAVSVAADQREMGEDGKLLYPHSIQSYSDTFTATNGKRAFLGWALTENGAVEYQADQTIKITGNVDLYAKWGNVYTVTYLPGTQGTFSQQAITDVPAGNTLPAFVGTPTGNPGYKFATWVLADANGTPVEGAVPGTVTQDLYLVATWINADDVTYQVQWFYATNGSYAPDPNRFENRIGTTAATASVVDADKVAAAGYVLDTNGGNVFEATINGDSSTVLKLYFKQVFTVTFQAGTNGTINGGTANVVGTHDYDATYPTAPVTAGNTGFTFDGWYLENGTAVTSFPGTVKENATYVAHWISNGGGGGGDNPGTGGGGNPGTGGGGDDGGDGGTNIPNEDVPLGNLPSREDANIPDEDIPLAEAPEEIPDEEVPLADAPKTGDVSGLWMALMGLSGTGATALVLGKKKEEEI